MSACTAIDTLLRVVSKQPTNVRGCRNVCACEVMLMFASDAHHARGSTKLDARPYDVPYDATGTTKHADPGGGFGEGGGLGARGGPGEGGAEGGGEGGVARNPHDHVPRVAASDCAPVRASVAFVASSMTLRIRPYAPLGLRSEVDTQ